MFFLIDIFLITIQIFPFIQLNDFIYLSSFIFNGPIYYRLLFIFALLIFLILFLFKSKFNIEEINIRSFGIFFIFIVFLNLIGFKYCSLFVNSQFNFFLKNSNFSYSEYIGSENGLMPNRYENLSHKLNDKLIMGNLNSKKILFIINESWGATLNKNYQDEVLFPIYLNRSKLEYIDQGSFSFVGSTIAGELRELCNVLPTDLDLKNINKKDFENCLPRKMLEKGYLTTSIHGADENLYNREKLYNFSGFQSSLFYKNLDRAGNCKSFNGRCDYLLIPYIKEILNKSEKSFVYWLTLNSHAPYDDKLFIENRLCEKLKINLNTEICDNFKLHYQFFESLGQIIEDPEMNGLEIYIVGDHSPPIFNMRDNIFGFKGSDVAWIHLKIKD